MSIYLGEDMVYRGHETIRQADANNVGGIKASAKTSDEDLEIKIDSETGKLYTKSFVPTNLTTLSTSGTISLVNNSVNKITPSGNVTFTLPSVSDNTKFHQILVQVNMSAVKSINVGTTYFFNKTAPDLSKTGVYDLYFEYDSSNSYWVCGLVSKGVAS